MNGDSIFPCVIACFIFAAFGFGFGSSNSNSRVKQEFEREAIRKGHAVWITDEKGHPVFQWKESCK